MHTAKLLLTNTNICLFYLFIFITKIELKCQKNKTTGNHGNHSLCMHIFSKTVLDMKMLETFLKFPLQYQYFVNSFNKINCNIFAP